MQMCMCDFSPQRWATHTENLRRKSKKALLMQVYFGLVDILAFCVEDGFGSAPSDLDVEIWKRTGARHALVYGHGLQPARLSTRGVDK